MSNDILFDSIKGDNYNLTSIYLTNYPTIKIQKQSSKKKNSLVCVLGILVNNNGIKIAKEMINWLTEEYEIYKIYQKYPGTLYEYPALRFSQWLTENHNISFLLYLHTKGASHQSFRDYTMIIRKFWEYEFTKPKNLKYFCLTQTNFASPLSKIAGS